MFGFLEQPNLNPQPGSSWVPQTNVVAVLSILKNCLAALSVCISIKSQYYHDCFKPRAFQFFSSKISEAVKGSKTIKKLAVHEILEALGGEAQKVGPMDLWGDEP